jgi:6-phosphogluconolactonase (cycloisomerase 2 family)
MRQWLRSHLTYANVMVTILAFRVLGGGTALAFSGSRRRLLLGAAAAAVFLAAAAPAQASPFAYVTNSSVFNDSVSQYDVGAGGLLAPLAPPAVAAGDGPEGIAVNPNGHSAYVTNVGADDVSQYDVGAGGALSPKSPPTVAAGSIPGDVAVSPDGGSVYVANFTAATLGGATVSQYDVGPGGALSPKSPAAVATGDGASGVAVSPDGESVYVTNFNGASVSQYNVGAGGGLAPKSPAAVASLGGADAVVVSPDGQSVYVANGGGSVSQYDVGAGGGLSPKNPATVAAGDFPIDLAVSPNGESVYVANEGTSDFDIPTEGNVSQYDVGAGGKLSPKSPGTVAVSDNPDRDTLEGVAVSPDAKSVYVTNLTRNTVSQLDVGPGGALTPKSPATVAGGGSPEGVAVGPGAPTSKDQCKHGGWRNFPQFKNQGQCIAFVNHHR